MFQLYSLLTCVGVHCLRVCYALSCEALICSSLLCRVERVGNSKHSVVSDGSVCASVDILCFARSPQVARDDVTLPDCYNPIL